MNIDLLKKLYSINSKSGHEEVISEYIQEYLTEYTKTTGITLKVLEDKTGNLLITKGLAETYPCLCAHMDEVHHKVNDIVILESGGYLFGWSNFQRGTVGIGADDKNGIFIALSALDELPAVKLLFTVGEEIGGVGSRKVDITNWLGDVQYVIQCDRRNGTDFITTAGGVKLASKAFKKEAGKILATFGFKKETGLFTDVQVLKENGLKVSACNLSCGYYNPHSDRECTNLAELENTYHAAVAICKALTSVYPHTYEGRSYANYGSSYGNWGGQTQRYNPKTGRWEYMDGTAVRDAYQSSAYKGLGFGRNSSESTPRVNDYRAPKEYPCTTCTDWSCIGCKKLDDYHRYPANRTFDDILGD